jgi:hypothetical protein
MRKSAEVRAAEVAEGAAEAVEVSTREMVRISRSAELLARMKMRQRLQPLLHLLSKRRRKTSRLSFLIRSSQAGEIPNSSND